MSFPRYPKYKDSGVEWLGEVPGHWGVGQSRRLFALRNERAFETDKQLTASQEHGVIYQEDFIRLEGRRVVQVIKGADILKHVEPNDFVISMRSFQGGIEWCQVRGCISSAYVMLVPCDRIHGPFFQYLLKSELLAKLIFPTRTARPINRFTVFFNSSNRFYGIFLSRCSKFRTHRRATSYLS